MPRSRRCCTSPLQTCHSSTASGSGGRQPTNRRRARSHDRRFQPLGASAVGLPIMAEYVFTLRNVRRAHGDKVVLDNVTLSFLHGAKIGVVGPNGTGKSTLLKIMAGLHPPPDGDADREPRPPPGGVAQGAPPA